MTSMIIAVIALTLINLVYKGVGPAVLRDRELPPRVQATVDAFPVALLAGLLTVELLGESWRAADATVLPGLAAATVGWLARLPQLACVTLAVVVTVLVRLAL